MRNNADFFHGTNKRFSPGDLILPPSVTGASAPTRAEYGDDWYQDLPEHHNRVFVSTDQDEANYYADRATKHFGGTPSIYHVEPIDKDSVEWEEYGEHSSDKGFRVVKQIK